MKMAAADSLAAASAALVVANKLLVAAKAALAALPPPAIAHSAYAPDRVDAYSFEAALARSHAVLEGILANSSAVIAYQGNILASIEATLVRTSAVETARHRRSGAARRVGAPLADRDRSRIPLLGARHTWRADQYHPVPVAISPAVMCTCAGDHDFEQPSEAGRPRLQPLHQDTAVPHADVPT